MEHAKRPPAGSQVLPFGGRFSKRDWAAPEPPVDTGAAVDQAGLALAASATMKP